jgi:hypothetical protein
MNHAKLGGFTDTNGATLNFMSGSMADCAVWNTNLSSSDIAKLAAGYRPIDVNSANLVGWWPLSGYSSPEPDISGNANNGTLTGTSQAAMPPYISRGARSCNGTGSLINCTSAAILNPSGAGASMTACVWAYPTSFPNAYNAVIGRSDGAAHYYVFQPRANGNLALYYTDNGGTAHDYDNTGSHTLTANSWYHLLFTIPASGNGLGYVNGSLDGTCVTAGGGIDTISQPTCFGSDNHGGNWAGYLADGAIWNTVLSGTDISRLASGERPINVSPGNLVGYWPLNGFSNTTENDLSGNGNNGTITPGSASGPFPILGPPQTWRLG